MLLQRCSRSHRAWVSAAVADAVSRRALAFCSGVVGGGLELQAAMNTAELSKEPILYVILHLHDRADGRRGAAFDLHATFQTP